MTYPNDSASRRAFRAASSMATATWASLTGKPSTFAPSAHTHPQSEITNLTTDLAGKQATLVSTTNIKSINGSSILGSGDLTPLKKAGWTPAMPFVAKDRDGKSDIWGVVTRNLHKVY